MASLEQEGLDASALERDADSQLTAERGLKAAFAVSWQQVANSPEAQQLARVLTLFAPVNISWMLVEAMAQTYDQLYPSVEQPSVVELPQAQTGWRRFWHWLWQQIQRWLGRQPSKRPQLSTPYPIAKPLEARGMLLLLNLIQRVDADNHDSDAQQNTSDDIQNNAYRPRQYRTGPAYRLHPLLREFFESQWSDTDRDGWQLAFALAIGDQARQVPKQLSWEDTAVYYDVQPHFSIAEQVLMTRARASEDAGTRRRYRTQAESLSAARFRLAQPVLFEATLRRSRKTYDEAKAFAQGGKTALANQKFAQTLEDYRQAIAQARQAFPSDSLQLAGYLIQIAGIFRELGRYQDGIDSATEAVDIVQGIVNPIKLTDYLHMLGVLHRHQGNHNKATQWLVESLSIRETYFGEENLAVANSINSLAVLFDKMGRYSEAESLYVRSLSIWTTQLGKGHFHVAKSLNNLALLYHSQGHYSKAEPLHKRSLFIRENQLGKDHLDVSTSLNNLALLYHSQGRYSEAEPLYVQSLFIKETQLGRNHPDVANNLNNLAFLHQAQGRYSEAEALCKQSISIGETQLGRDHPDVANSLHDLARLYHSQGRYSEAKLLYERSLSIRETKLGKDHPYVVTSLNNLAGLYESQGRYGKAELLYVRSLSISETQLGKDHPDVAFSLNNLASLYASQGRYGEAKPLYVRSLSIREIKLGKDHQDVATSLNNLATLYQFQGHYGEAEPLYLRSLDIYQKTLPENHPYINGVRGNLEGLVKATLKTGQEEQLSDHPMTQEILQRLKEEEL
ncbi:MAG: tetratricopeptide repeat protein [Cyanobacteria bacterium P01_F01_bin.150]